MILVKDRKTLYSHGHARIVLSQKLCRWLQIFVPEVRSRVSGATNDNDHHVFLSWNGESLASSQISKAMKSVWKKADIGGTIHTTYCESQQCQEYTAPPIVVRPTVI